MQEAIPFRAYHPAGTSVGDPEAPCGKTIALASGGNSGGLKEYVRELVSENPIIVFGRRGCCMSHVVRRLLLGFGVNPPVYEVEERDEGTVKRELSRINAGTRNGELPFPVVFVGGRLFGGLDRIMATHISGELVPILKDAGALWL